LVPSPPDLLDKQKLEKESYLNPEPIRQIMKTSKYQVYFLITGFLFCLAVGIYIGSKRGLPFVSTQGVWSIGILEGPSPFQLTAPKTIKNPILTHEDVTDIEAELVADPFMVINDSKYYMFFEVLNKITQQGDIGLASSSDGLNWDYEKIILDEPFHLSYPYVFSWEGEHYLIPESNADFSIRLYKATNFPTQWEFVGTLLKGFNFVDPSIFRFGGKWWLFFSLQSNDILYLYYADDLMGPWIHHPKSPLLKKNPDISRPGGRVLVLDNKVFRFAQDDYPTYGNQLNVFEITELNSLSYKEKPLDENPLLQGSGTGWNADGMHHIDVQSLDDKRWLAVVDGQTNTLRFGLDQ
jgi:hypothetical protein